MPEINEQVQNNTGNEQVINNQPPFETSAELSEERLDSMSVEDINNAMKNESAEPKKEKENVKTEVPKEEDEVTKTKRMYEESQAMIKRQAEEVGKKRKFEEFFNHAIQNPKDAIEYFQRLAGQTNEPQISDEEMTQKFFENPTSFLKEWYQKQRYAEIRQQQIQSQMQYQTTEQYKNDTQEFLKQVAPDVENVKSQIYEIMKADGLPEKYISMIDQNFYAQNPQDRAHILQYYKRAKLEQEIKDLKAQLSKASSLPDKINAAARAKPAITNKNFGQPNASSESLTDDELDNMSLEDINNELKKLKGR